MVWYSWSFRVWKKQLCCELLLDWENCGAGVLTINDRIIFGKNKINVAPEKRNIGFVFQNLALWPHMTALKNVAFMLPGKLKKKQRYSKSKELLKSVHLNEALFSKYPDQLSAR